LDTDLIGFFSHFTNLSKKEEGPATQGHHNQSGRQDTGFLPELEKKEENVPIMTHELDENIHMTSIVLYSFRTGRRSTMPEAEEPVFFFCHNGQYLN
jgi:hypothetical protein